MRFLLIPLLILASCSTYEPTQADRGATAGAVVGGGLGAVIGSQAGNPAGGLALGTITGAGVGAMIGHRFQEKDDVIDSQAETINQQQRQIQIHQDEVEQLRQATQDQVAFAPEINRPNNLAERNLQATFPSAQVGNSNFEQTDLPITNDSPNVIEKLPEVTETATSKIAVTEDPREITSASDVMPTLQETIPPVQDVQVPSIEQAQIDNSNFQQPLAISPSGPSQECLEAEKEVASAAKADITAEKLYHFRRAERLCPQDLNVHLGLGKVYLQLDRKEDARTAFEEVLKLAPDNAEAKDLMRQL